MWRVNHANQGRKAFLTPEKSSLISQGEVTWAIAFLKSQPTLAEQFILLHPTPSTGSTNIYKCFCHVVLLTQHMPCQWPCFPFQEGKSCHELLIFTVLLCGARTHSPSPKSMAAFPLSGEKPARFSDTLQLALGFQDWILTLNLQLPLQHGRGRKTTKREPCLQEGKGPEVSKCSSRRMDRRYLTPAENLLTPQRSLRANPTPGFIPSLSHT